MAAYLTARVQVLPEAEGARYLFAPRELGAVRHFGWIPIAVGLGLAITVISQVASFADRFLPSTLPAEAAPESSSSGVPLEAIVLAGAVLIGLLALLVALRIARFGLFVLAGHSEIRLARGRITGSERVGGLSRSRSLAAGDVVVLRIVDALTGQGEAWSRARDAEAAPPPARLEAWTGRGRHVALATGYPAAELDAVARDLAQRFPSAAGLRGGLLANAPAVERRDAASRPGVATATPEAAAAERAAVERAADAERAATPPPGTAITVERGGGGLVVQVPPPGLLRGSHGLFLMGAIWAAISVAFAVAVIAAPLGGGRDDDQGALVAIPFVLFFVAIGVAMLYFSARLGTRRTTMTVAPPQLRWESVALGQRRAEELDLSRLRAVAVGPTGVRINNRPVLQLELHLAGGEVRGLLRERTPDELAWLAAVLRRELGLGETASETGHR